MLSTHCVPDTCFVLIIILITIHSSLAFVPITPMQVHLFWVAVNKPKGHVSILIYLSAALDTNNPFLHIKHCPVFFCLQATPFQTLQLILSFEYDI